MINEILWFTSLVVCLFSVIIAYKLFGKIGLFIWTATAVILANIQVFKIVKIFGLDTALGNVVYASIFLVTDILNENHSKKDAQMAVWIGFFVLISTTIIMQITLLFIPSEADIVSDPIAEIFSLMPRIAFASLTAYLISQNHDVWFYSRLKKKDKNKRLWFRNNVSTIISQLIDNIVFTSIAFIGLIPWDSIVQIFFTSYLLKVIVAGCDTPFIYLSKKIHNNYGIAFIKKRFQ